MRRHTDSMATYTISSNADGATFDVAVIGSDGVHHTMLGFATRADAEAWIAQDSRLTDTVEPEEARAGEPG
jgi:hypothetical protein